MSRRLLTPFGWITPRRSLFVLSLLCFCVAPFAAHAQRSAVTIPRALDQLTAEADTIVHASVVTTKIEPHPKLRNLNTIVVTLQVQDTYKGTARKSLVFRQYIWENPNLEASQYRKGQELILFLGPVSEYGLSSPVGLEQGRFRILREGKSGPTAVNGRGNAGLFTSMVTRAKAQNITLSPRTSELAQRNAGGAIRLADMEDAIRTFVGKR